MSQRARVYVKGKPALVAAIGALPDAFRAEIADTFAIGASIILSEALGRVPVADVEGGELHDSLGADIAEDGQRAVVAADTPYARFVELGWSEAPAQPFLYPGFRVGTRYVRGRIREWMAGAAARVSTRTKRGRKARKR